MPVPLRPQALILISCVVLCSLSSACFFGRRGRNLDRAVEHTYQCAAAEGFRYENLGPNRYRVRACYNRADQRYRYRAVFHCSYKRCASLSARAVQFFSAATGCPVEKVEARETVDSSIFHVLGCEAEATLSCGMRDNEVSCQPMLALTTMPASAAPASSGGEVLSAPDAGP